MNTIGGGGLWLCWGGWGKLTEAADLLLRDPLLLQALGPSGSGEVGDRRPMDTDGLETFPHLLIDGRVADLLLPPSAGAGRSRRPNQEGGGVPARRGEGNREWLVGERAVEKVSPKSFEEDKR